MMGTGLMGLVNFLSRIFKKHITTEVSPSQNFTEMQKPRAQMELPIFQISKNVSLLFKTRMPEKEVEPPFKIHKDLIGLLWFGDGPMQNYNPENDAQQFSDGPVTMRIHVTGDDEPSAIYSELPFIIPQNKNAIPSPGYFPEYKRLTPEQRGVYLEFLKDPYQKEIDIGYIFILYYGLERHLLLGNYYRARDVVMKMRRICSNGSFLSYSTNSLFLCAVIHEDHEFIKSFIHDFEENNLRIISKGMLLRYCYCVNMYLPALFIMKLSGVFGFSNRLYIEKYPELFLDHLKIEMNEKFGMAEINLRNVLSDRDFLNMPNETAPFLANTSIRKYDIQIPDVLSSEKLSLVIRPILEQTHEKVKIVVAEMRKKGLLSPNNVEKKPKISKTPKVLPVFDEFAEKELLKDLQKNTKAHDFIALHEIYDKIIRFYYSYRELNDKYIDICASYCRKQIDNLPMMEQMFIEKQIKEERHFRKIEGERIFREQVERIRNAGYLGRVEGFRRLMMIYKKRKDFDNALIICDEAVAWKKDYAKEWQEEKSKILKLRQKHIEKK